MTPQEQIAANLALIATMTAQIAAQKAELASARSTARATFRLAVTEKGGVTAYGLGSRFPTTLYKEQWTTLLSHAEDIKAFINANNAKLISKADFKARG